jgi:hypothetical protein
MTYVVLSVALAALLGAATAGAWARLHFARTAQTFRCKVRWPEDWTATAPRWPRRRVRAAWVHDVLLVQRGVVRPRTEVFAACGAPHGVRRTGRCEVSGLGADPVALTLRLDAGGIVDVAARGRDATALAGPFLVAVLSGMPRARREF